MVIATVASGCCDRSGCDAVSGPASSSTIAQGIAGAGAYANDVRELTGCVECPSGGGTITLVDAESEVLDDAEAFSLFTSDAAREVIEFSERYEHSTDARDFLACVAFAARGICAPVKVVAAAVTTVHLTGSFGGPGLVVFTADGSRDERSYFVDLTGFVAEE